MVRPARRRRLIVSPDDAIELSDLKAYTRDLMAQAERDLGTSLDWVAADHWNTGHPHIHVLVRGRTDQGEDLVISRDYISSGLRHRAGHLVTLELGPRSDLEIRRILEAEIDAERWTRLDRAIARDAERGVVDLRPPLLSRPDAIEAAKVGRMNKLADLGLAEPLGPAQWRLRSDAEQALRQLGQRNDIIARLHRALGPEHGAGDYVLDSAALTGVVRRRLTLTSGRFAMIDDGLGFSLVPWKPELERQLGRHISGVALPGGGVDWDLGRGRGLGL